MTRLYLTMEEIRQKFGVDEIVITAEDDSMSASGNFRQIDILYTPRGYFKGLYYTFIQLNQKEDKFYKEEK